MLLPCILLPPSLSLYHTVLLLIPLLLSTVLMCVSPNPSFYMSWSFYILLSFSFSSSILLPITIFFSLPSLCHAPCPCQSFPLFCFQSLFSPSDCPFPCTFSLLLSPAPSSYSSFCHAPLFLWTLCAVLFLFFLQLSVVLPVPPCLSSSVLHSVPIISCFSSLSMFFLSCSISLSFSLLLSLAFYPSVLLTVPLSFAVSHFLAPCPSPVFYMPLSFILSFLVPLFCYPSLSSFFFHRSALALSLSSSLSLSLMFLSPSLPHSLSFFSYALSSILLLTFYLCMSIPLPVPSFVAISPCPAHCPIIPLCPAPWPFFSSCSPALVFLSPSVCPDLSLFPSQSLWLVTCLFLSLLPSLFLSFNFFLNQSVLLPAHHFLSFPLSCSCFSSAMSLQGSSSLFN